MVASTHRCDGLLTQSAARLPSLEDGGRAESAKLLTVALSLLVTSPVQSHLRSCQEPQTETNTYISDYVSVI